MLWTGFELCAEADVPAGRIGKGETASFSDRSMLAMMLDTCASSSQAVCYYA